MTSSLATRVFAVESVTSHRHPGFHSSGSQNHIFMAGPVNPGSDPVTFHNPISRTSNNPVVSSSSSIAAKSGPITSLLKSAEPKGGSSLSSIASAGLRTSPSPIMASNSRLSPQPATTSNLGRSHDRSRERASSQQTSQQNPRDVRTSGSHATNERRDKAHEAAASTSSTDPVDSAQKLVPVSADDPRKDSHIRRASPAGMSDTFDGGENTTLMNSRTVASPGPIDEPNPMENERSRRREEDIMMEEGNKAFSYPVPMPASSINDSRRGMSLPHAGFNKGGLRSPSAKKHRCHHCATEFTRHHNLKSHLLTHSQEKPYVCQTCQSRFRRLHDLKRHTKLHTGERPHICPKCGRRFARGDALARHNKGQGGCAGRRSSLGSFLGDDEYGDGGGPGGEDGMEGLMYTEPDRMDEEDEKRLNMPSIKKHNPPDSLQRTSSTGGHVAFQSHQSSTYPPLAASRPSQGSLFPPVSSHPGSSSSPSPISQSGNASFPPGGGSGSSSGFNAQQQQQQQGSSSSVFAQNNITESPKPLSPNVIPTRQLSHGSDHNAQQHSRGGLSPSLKPQYQSQQQQQQQQFGRNGAPGTSSGPAQILPAPQLGAPQLPLPHGLNNPDARFPLHSPNPSQSQNHNPPHLPSHPHPPPHHQNHNHNHSNSIPSPDLNNLNNNTNSNTNLFSQQRQLSTSSHHLTPTAAAAAATATTPPDRIWSYMRTLEDRVNGLEEEVVRLREQLATTGGGGGGGGSGNVANGA
ncbi:hypothetical protein GX50_02107 [[Emmonsia] crescens]|uniref:C2H2-type domain-containing protein n=1 Tax=[Emmonsia] crescens TaxID=73230 RepID=A0A2B7ZM63_9EURO|nr:hypothetical protein GX50_02107 [Emmonsia crescens]